MNVDLPKQNDSLSMLESFAVSLGFWLTLISASAMYAVLVLAPKFVESSQIQQHSQQLQSLSDERTQEVEHLSRLANAIEHDSDFLTRIRSNEFSLKREGTIQIAVPSELGFDARVPQGIQEHQSITPAWYHDALIQVSTQTRLRRNWSCVMVALYLVAFLFMNESFFSGNFGRSLLRATGNLFQRYRAKTPNLEEEGCQPTP